MTERTTSASRRPEARPRRTPPLKNLRAIMDANGITRAQLAARTGLSQPTVTRVLRGAEGVRTSTAEAVAKAVGVPVYALHADLIPEELMRQARLPAVTAGRDYAYPTALPQRGEERRTEPSAREREGSRQYVIMHRDDLDALHLRLGALGRIEERLGAVEEALAELATRPLAKFDVEINLKERDAS